MYRFNNKNTLNKRRGLRKDLTTPENIVWQRIRARQLNGYKFRRQYGIGDYIVDFYCAEQRLIIEIDGDSHYEECQIIYDEIRTKYLESFNNKVIRFTNNEVMENLEGVLESITSQLKQIPHLPSPNLGEE